MTVWTPSPTPTLPEAVFPPAPKPTGIARPIVEFDVRFLRSDGMEYADGDSIEEDDGGVGWQDLAILNDPQGRTDAGLTGFGGAGGNILFVKNGWNEERFIDAVRFVGDPINDPADPQGSFLRWPGGGLQPENSNWPGNEYSYIGVMRCTDISQYACLFGGTSGIIPVNGNPKKTAVWVQPDGSVAMHNTDEESFGAVQPGSIFSLESAPGIVKAGDSVIITVTASALFGPTQGKTLRVNGVEVARNVNATRVLNEMSSPSLGQGFPQQDGSPGDPGSIGGLDKLIVYFAAFGTLLTQQQIEEYEAFLALTFQISIGTAWEFRRQPSPLDETEWVGAIAPPLQPVIANQVIELDSRPDLPDPALLPPGEPNRFGIWPDTSGNGVQVNQGANQNNVQPIWEPNGWDPTGRAIGAVSFRDIQEHMNVFDGGFGLQYGGNFLTLFFVVEATDLSSGEVIVVIGGNDNRVRRNVSVIITTAGAVEFNFNDPGSDDNTTTADGLVAEGDRILITCQHWAAGRTIRVNGVVVGTSIGTNHLITYPTMFISNFRFAEGASMRLGWYSGHNSEITDAEVLEMEAFLRGAFFTADPPPPTGWVP